MKPKFSIKFELKKFSDEISLQLLTYLTSNLAYSQVRLQTHPAYLATQTEHLWLKKLGRDKLANLDQNSSAWRHTLGAEEIWELVYVDFLSLTSRETEPILKSFFNCVQRSQSIQLISTGSKN